MLLLFGWSFFLQRNSGSTITRCLTWTFESTTKVNHLSTIFRRRGFQWLYFTEKTICWQIPGFVFLIRQYNYMCVEKCPSTENETLYRTCSSWLMSFRTFCRSKRWIWINSITSISCTALTRQDSFIIKLSNLCDNVEPRKPKSCMASWLE